MKDHRVKDLITLDVAGSRIQMRSDASREHLEALAAEVDRRMNALGPKANRLASPSQRLAVVALHLAEELSQERDALAALTRQTRAMVEQAIQRIDASLTVPDSRTATDRRVGEESGGVDQRVEVARACLNAEDGVKSPK